MGEDYMTGLDTQIEGDTSLASPRPPALELDAEKHLTEMADFDMTEVQKTELLETLWSIMRSFVELGFSVNICEQILENAGAVSGGAPDGVKSLHPTAAAETPSDGTEKESA